MPDEVEKLAEKLGEKWKEFYPFDGIRPDVSVWPALARVALEFCEERRKKEREEAEALWQKERDGEFK